MSRPTAEDEKMETWTMRRGYELGRRSDLCPLSCTGSICPEMTPDEQTLMVSRWQLTLQVRRYVPLILQDALIYR